MDVRTQAMSGGMSGDVNKNGEELKHDRHTKINGSEYSGQTNAPCVEIVRRRLLDDEQMHVRRFPLVCTIVTIGG